MISLIQAAAPWAYVTADLISTHGALTFLHSVFHSFLFYPPRSPKGNM